MADDWRVRVTLPDRGYLHDVLDFLRGHEVERTVRKRLGDRVAVTAADDRVFLYADTLEAATEAERVVREALAEADVEGGDVVLERWHPVAEAWKPGEVPLPETEAARAEEHAELEERETEESEATGKARWEVRVTLASHTDATELAERLEAQGLGVKRRWRYVLVGASNEDEAHALEEQIRAELPEDADTEVEPSAFVVQDAMRNPFAIFGGLFG